MVTVFARRDVEVTVAASVRRFGSGSGVPIKVCIVTPCEDGRMSGDGSTLVKFLTARLGEDENRIDMCDQCGHSRLDHEIGRPYPGCVGRSCGCMTFAGWPDPTRALVDVVAKRRILEQYQAAYRREVVAFDDEETHGSGAHVAVRVRSELWTTLLLLALPYAEHPDYRKEWKP